MSHVCGCRACWEADALTLAEMAEHKADFDRWLAKRQERLSGLKPLPADHETDALLALVRLPVPVVKAVPG